MVEEKLPIHKQKKIKSDDFMSKPSNAELNGEQEEIERNTATYKDNSGRFKITKKEFVQYSHIYMHRLQRMRPFIQQQAQNKWCKDKLKVVDKILHLEPGHKCIITGTIYKDMPLKPNVLKEYAKDRAILPVPVKKSFVSDGDFLVIEDETGRVKLQGLDAGPFVTGIPVALKGAIAHQGEFIVEDFCVAGFPPQPDTDINDNNNNEKEKEREREKEKSYVAIVSGLNLGHADSDDVTISLLVDYLSGVLGSGAEQQFTSSIVRVILAGNNVCSLKNTEEGTLMKYQTTKQINEEHAKMSRPIAELDQFLSLLAPSIPIDVMPGENDPANFSLPQQALNKCMLPLSSRFGSVKPVTNPYEAEISGKIFLGTSGQPTSNAARYMTINEKEGIMGLMEQTLKWRHIAPTVPDTLAAYPFKDDDPFILDQCPHVYFIGNQKEGFQTSYVTGPESQAVRLIMVPDFSLSHSIVLVDLDTLHAFPVSFKVEDLADSMAE